jgi:hypothetical protein
MPYTPTTTATTESEAIAAILAAGGQPQVSSLVTVRPDQTAASKYLKDALKEVCGEGWTFNTEFGYELMPGATYDWTGTWDDTPVTLNVFLPPANLLSFEVTKTSFQQGGDYLDTVIRPSRTYGGGGVMVFYDRALNRDGFERPSIYINPVWLYDFEKVPQVARDLVRLKATRRFLAEYIGDSSQDARISQDELVNLRQLKQKFGIDDDYNLYNNAFFDAFRGGRAPLRSGIVDGRYSPGG